jgi:hypothetical protein
MFSRPALANSRETPGSINSPQLLELSGIR